jgi:hypothetical protein
MNILYPDGCCVRNEMGIIPIPLMPILFYAFTLWLGSYLLVRSSQKMAVRLTGWGLLAYAVALASQVLFHQFFLIVLLLPALLWIGAALHLLPEEAQPVPS